MATPPGGWPRGQSHRRHRHRSRSRHSRSNTPPYVAALIALLMIGAGGLMTWRAVEYFLHAARKSAAATTISNVAVRNAEWQRDVLGRFNQAAQQAKSGDTTAAEVNVDEAVAEMEEARVRFKQAPTGFFGRASAALDAILKASPNSASLPATGNDDAASPTQSTPPDTSLARLFEHVTQARVELAAMRSSQEPLPPGAKLESDAEASAADSAANSAATGETPDAAPAASDLPTGPQAAADAQLKLPAGHIAPDGPRDLSANEVVNPGSMGGNFLDASLFPDTSEILLPPETRQLSDNVRVENLTIAGASQTLDGIHWRNVTFIDTRLRYEDGPLDLKDVRFVQCTFGFPSSARGAIIANAIALGQTSIAIQ